MMTSGTHSARVYGRKYTLMRDFKSSVSGLFARGGFPEEAFYIDKVFHSRKLIVYGAGESFHYFKEIVMRQYGYRPAVVLDRKFHTGDSFEGIPAFSPETYQPSREDQETAVVVVCLGQQHYFQAVLQTLKEKGFRHIIALMDIYEIHNPFRLPLELEDAGFGYYVQQRGPIEKALSLLADDESRDVFLGCLRTHMQRKPVAIPMRDRREQYTPRDVPLCRSFSRFLYCGVSVGEMARVFTDIGSVEELVCFEPDPAQFRLTADFVSAHRTQLAKRVTALPCAVYDHETIQPFTTSDTSFGSRILPSGQNWVQCVSIDRILPDFHPTFILMDIEGSEPAALKGAEQTLRRDSPDLAICVYHAPHHLWEIPLYLDSLGVGYRFYLRNYTSFVGETVLYAAV